MTLNQDLTLSIVSVDVVRSPADVLIDVSCAGLCGSDLHAIHTGDWVGYWPAILGHEVTGYVREVPLSPSPNGRELTPGDQVVVDSRIACGVCKGCRTSARLCERLTWLGESRAGGFSTLLSVPASLVHLVPRSTEPCIMVLAEPLAVAIAATRHVSAASPQQVVIFGYGPIGALCHATLELLLPTAAVFVVERNQARATTAAANGAQILQPDSALSPDAIIEAAGYPEALNDAIRLSHRGTAISLVALAHTASAVLASQIVEKDLTIRGSNGFDTDDLEMAIQLLAEHPDRFAPIVTHRLSLEEFSTALPDDLPPDALKVVVDFTA
ncbi:alcohol dehydrogenase catalytic domain-containing protein [Pseudoclavibacter sp. CFCC 11306]|uniref:zinc-dependent alcohol dehydrogenase n=1 Tax=Pseudoclavibacter sp. CFCC 11306 TaxID=1564493 RepID=UPI001CE3CE2C